jgi:hypothetical protein
VEIGAWELTYCSQYVSELFLVAKPGINWWRFIVDLRHMKSSSVKRRLRMESRLEARHLARKGGNIFSFDLKDGLCALGIVHKQRGFLVVNVRGRLYRLAGLPMGWSLNPYLFCAFADTFVRHLRQPDPNGFTTKHGRPTHPDGNTPSKRYLRHTRLRAPISYLTSTSSSSSRRPGSSCLPSFSESTASSPVSDCSASLPRVYGSQPKRDTTWASIST